MTKKKDKEEEEEEAVAVVVEEEEMMMMMKRKRMATMMPAKEERKMQVKQLFYLLKSERILEILQHHQSPGLDPVKAAHIEEWRASILASNNEAGTTEINGQHVSIEVES
ncbi:hypothetical protein F511_26721 [Dorcoceras hygrometricum]|uniref:Uncharacterized protein n=1 Tax=Dorcoceras hygrometricum TaxID=472368 RepID=A0A2Z7CG58_9LAMI|nr:hypothetical protein F511_26721 [Dorcoceras hygrometricum]